MTENILSLHRNEYYFPHAPSVSRLLAGPLAAELVSTYTTRETIDSFICEVAESLAVNPASVTLYHGAEDALFKTLSWAAARQMTVHTTSLGWAEYMRLTQGLELEVRQTPLVQLADQYCHPAEAFEQSLASEPARALVLLASPNNPTGHGIAPEEIVRLARRFPQHTFLIDAVYATFASETFVPPAACPNVIVLGSFSKFFGLPGLRVGFAVGQVPSVQSMALGPSPLAIGICRAALRERDFYAHQWEIMQATARSLQRHNTPAGIFFKTQAPFVLFRCGKGLTEKDVSLAQKNASVRGKVLTSADCIQIRWSLGSAEAGGRILKAVSTLETLVNH